MFYERTSLIFGECVFQESQHSYGCSAVRKLVPLYVRDRLHAETSEEKGMRLSRSFIFKFRYIDDDSFILLLNYSKLMNTLIDISYRA